MKELELKPMEIISGGKDCAAFGAGIAVGGIILGIASGGVAIAVGALVGGWLGVGGYGACIFN